MGTLLVDPYAVLRDSFIRGDELKTFRLGLSNQQPVKGIMMKRRQSTCLLTMKYSNRQFYEACFFDDGIQVIGSLKFLLRLFDGNFPRRDGADIHEILAILNQRSYFPIELSAIGKPPEKDVRIEQNPFQDQSPSNEAMMSSEVFRKSDDIRIWPLRRPGFLFLASRCGVRFK